MESSFSLTGRRARRTHAHETPSDVPHVTCRYGYYTPAPFNLWMNVADKPDTSGYIWVMPPSEQKAGDYCIFRAEQDLVAAMSACPWDLGDM